MLPSSGDRLFEKKTRKVTALVGDSLANMIDEWRIQNRVWSLSEAVRILIEAGLDAKQTKVDQ